MLSIIKKIIILLLVFVCFKLTAQERQIPFDLNEKINIIDAALEKKLALFSDYPGFIEARLYQNSDSVFTLEISHMTEKSTLRIRKILTCDEAFAFRTLVSEKIRKDAPHSLLDQSGRTSLLVSTTLIGTYLYGSSVSTLIAGNTYDFNPGIYLLTAGSSFLIPYFITKNKEVTKAEAYTSFYGMSRGYFHGLLLPLLFSSDPDEKSVFGLGTAVSITEGILGYKWAKKYDFSEGRSLAIGTFGDFGMAIGLGAGHLLGLYEGKSTTNFVALSILAGAGGGIYTGYRMSAKENYTTGDVVALQVAGSLGAYIPASLMYIAGIEEPKLYTLASLFGALSGLYLGDALAQKQEFSTRQGTLIGLSQFSGMLIGMGLGYLIDSSEKTAFNRDAKTMALLTGVGSAVGYWLAVKNYSKDINKEDKNLSMKFSINPLGLLNTASGKAANMHLPVFVGSLRF